MNKEEIMRKRQIELNKQLDDVKFQLEMQKDLNSESMKKAKILIAEVENINKEISEVLEQLIGCREEYHTLIDEMKGYKSKLDLVTNYNK